MNRVLLNPLMNHPKFLYNLYYIIFLSRTRRYLIFSMKILFLIPTILIIPFQIH